MSAKTGALAWELGEKLRARQWTVSAAESCTGGGICQAITTIPGSSQWFEQGFVTYSNRVKQSALGVGADILAEFGAVSGPVVEAMAIGAQQRSGAQLAVAVSGIAGPDGGTDEKPVGTVWFAWALNDQLITAREIFVGTRDDVRQQAVDRALVGLLAIVQNKTAV